MIQMMTVSPNLPSIHYQKTRHAAVCYTCQVRSVSCTRISILVCQAVMLMQRELVIGTSLMQVVGTGYSSQL